MGSVIYTMYCISCIVFIMTPFIPYLSLLCNSLPGGVVKPWPPCFHSVCSSRHLKRSCSTSILPEDSWLLLSQPEQNWENRTANSQNSLPSGYGLPKFIFWLVHIRSIEKWVGTCSCTRVLRCTTLPIHNDIFWHILLCTSRYTWTPGECAFSKYQS